MTAFEAAQRPSYVRSCLSGSGRLPFGVAFCPIETGLVSKQISRLKQSLENISLLQNRVSYKLYSICNAHSFELHFNVWHFSLYTSTYLYIHHHMQLHTLGKTIMGVENMLNNHHFYNLKCSFFLCFKAPVFTAYTAVTLKPLQLRTLHSNILFSNNRGSL